MWRHQVEAVHVGGQAKASGSDRQRGRKAQHQNADTAAPDHEAELNELLHTRNELMNRRACRP
jgi:hypothetical protein